MDAGDPRPRCVRATLLFAALLAVLAAAPAAHAAAPDLVVSQAKAFSIAAVGWKTYADVTVKNAGNRAAGASTISLRLTSGGKRYALRPSPSAVPRLGPGKTRKLDVAARLPDALAQGATFALQVCADAKRAVREANEGNNCRSSGTATVVGPTTPDLINEALARGLLTKGKAALLKAQYLAGASVPTRFRAPAPPGEVDGHEAIVELAANYASLSEADKARVGPYALPNGLRPYLLGDKPLPPVARVAAASDVSCLVTPLGGEPIDVPTVHSYIYEPVPAADGKAVVWWEKRRPAHEASAIAYAAALTEAWPTLTSAFKEPLSDADRVCLNAGDGRFDVYVATGFSNRAETKPTGIREPSDGPDGWRIGWAGCTNTPSYIDIKPGQPRWVVAHELLHAIQFAYTYRDCAGNAWIDEGTATWAGDYVFPGDNATGEHQFLASFAASAGPVWQAGYEYDTWLFWYALAKSTGVGTLKSVFTALAAQTSRAAVNSAIPGGFATQYPRYLQWLWNAPPVGESGFPLAKSYKGWDSVNDRPEASVDRALSLGAGQSERTFDVRVLRSGEGDYCKKRFNTSLGVAVGDCVDGRLGPQAGVYHRFTFPDNKVREIHFKNGMAGKTGQHVEAWIKLADGSWKAEDWSAGEKKLCRDKASEDVRELYLVSSNVAASGDGFLAEGLDHELRVTDICELVPHSGTFSGTARFVPEVASPENAVDFTTTFSGHMRLAPTNDPATNGRGLKIVSGSFQITNVSGVIQTCTISSTGGTFTLPAGNQANLASMLVFGPTIGAYVAAPFPDELPPTGPLTVPVTYSGPDCSADGERVDYSLIGLGGMMAFGQAIIPDENGVIAVTNLEVDNRLTTGWIEHYTFSFAPEN